MLTPENCWRIENRARACGGGYSDQVVGEMLAVLARDEMHFEAILGYFQTQQIRSGSDRTAIQTYASLYSWFAWVISEMIFADHFRNLNSLLQPPEGYERGLRFLVQENRPLWIFSLNYDLVIECLCAALRIPLSSGLPEKGSLPRRNIMGIETGKLATEVISVKQLSERGLVFPFGDEQRVHLIKAHGGLDMFTVHDESELVKISPVGDYPISPLGNLCILRNEVILKASPNPSVPLPPSEYLYFDESGRLQFLRHSIVTGAFKFDRKYHQVLPLPMLEAFRNYIRSVSKLVTIGYSFGDVHINLIIRNWVEMSREHQVVIIDPRASAEVPSVLLHAAPQVDLRKITARDFFGSLAS